MTTQELKRYIQHPEYLDKSTLSDMRQLVDTYPYCATFTILYAKNLHNVNDLQFRRFLKKASLSCYHRQHLQQLIDTPAVVEIQQPAAKNDLPISQLVSSSELSSTYQLVELPEPETSKPLKQQALIDKFIANNPRIQLSDNKFEYEDPTANNEKESLSDSVFTETMAKIYIKQGQYTKALHIFEKLNLKYPEKSTYFADQIRFLNKIIQTNS